MSSILIVATEPTVRSRVGALLEDDGWEVLHCPGPAAPDYVCVGVRGDGCPLADDADAVVLDLDLDSDLVLEGTTAVELMAFYLSGGLPMIALAHEGVEFTHPFAEERIRVLRWPGERDLLLDSLHTLAPREEADELSQRRRLAGG